MLIINTTYSHKKEAKKRAKKLILKNLAACVQIQKINSNYLWNKKVYTQKEFLITIKTNKKRFHKVYEFITKSHSYEIPEYIVYKPKFVSKKYKKWLNQSLN